MCSLFLMNLESSRGDKLYTLLCIYIKKNCDKYSKRGIHKVIKEQSKKHSGDLERL